MSVAQSSDRTTNDPLQVSWWYIKPNTFPRSICSPRMDTSGSLSSSWAVPHTCPQHEHLTYTMASLQQQFVRRRRRHDFVQDDIAASSLTSSVGTLMDSDARVPPTESRIADVHDLLLYFCRFTFNENESAFLGRALSPPIEERFPFS